MQESEERKPKINVCPKHPENQVAMLSTMAFRGAEFWCPYCGHLEGMFGGMIEVDLTEELKKETIAWKEKTKAFLNALSTFTCSKLEWEGKMISPTDLPEAEIIKQKNIVRDWKYEYKR